MSALEPASPRIAHPPSANASKLFRLILPREGYRAGAATWQPKDGDTPALYNRLFDIDAELAQWTVAKAYSGNVWHATATFKEVGEIARDWRFGFKGRRDELNLCARQCFHGDVDVGEDKPYVRFDHAKAALGWAIAKLGLPSPVTVCSGHGLHFYWPLTAPMSDVRLWRAYAGGIAGALEGQGLKLDKQCSADPVRLLRPPGTANHKGGNRLPVFVDSWGDGPVELGIFDKLKLKVRRKFREQVHACAPLPATEFPAVLRRCRQINDFARKMGAVPEPQWKACLGVLAFVEHGREIAHEYSKGDLRYDPDETDKKFDERCKLSGPSTCMQFQSLGNGLCEACTWRSPAISSPLLVGRAG